VRSNAGANARRRLAADGLCLSIPEFKRPPSIPPYVPRSGNSTSCWGGASSRLSDPYGIYDSPDPVTYWQPARLWTVSALGVCSHRVNDAATRSRPERRRGGSLSLTERSHDAGLEQAFDGLKDREADAQIPWSATQSLANHILGFVFLFRFASGIVPDGAKCLMPFSERSYLGLGGSLLCMSVAAIAAWPKATPSWCKSVTTSPAA
jgi:hypothetical protein